MRLAGVVFAGVEEQQIAWRGQVAVAAHFEVSAPVLDKPDHIMFVKMIWELLHDPLKTIGFYS